MAVHVNINKEKLQIMIDNAGESVVSILSSEILNDCNQYCKMDTGLLIASSYIHSKLDKGLLIWQTPYARRQYYEIQTAYKDNNPNASWKWCEVAKSKHQREWGKKAQRLLGMMQ